MLLGVDVGGTFTDAVVVDGDRIHTAKVPTTPRDQSAGVISAVHAALAAAESSPERVAEFCHGMTVGTNALLEESGARTALIATAGFADVLEIGRQNRPELYRPCRDRPPPLVGPELRFEVAERTGPDGILEPLTAAEIATALAAVRESGVDSVAICLLFAHVDDAHERALAEAIRRELPAVHVSASHEVLPRFREFERSSTTVIDAYLSPLLATYLGRLAEAAAGEGLPKPLVMQSSGGVVPAEDAARAGAWSVLSGPAGGAVGAALLASTSGDGNALGFDMGGTSCDVCVIEAGEVRRTDGREVEGRPLQLPMVDVHTVGAGGGSVAWRDPGDALRVGPRSAGSEPGPACYGRGGTEPTVTDANLVLGYLEAGATLAGGVALDRAAAESAIEPLAAALDLEPIEAAAGVIRVANQEMVRALRVVTVERGVDPRRFALLPFGGAGPMHAAAIADELGISRILCPRAGGVLSALGLCASDRRRDTARTLLLSGAELSAERLAAEVDALAEKVDLGIDGERPIVSFGMRYAGQAFELEVPGPTRPDPAELIAGFERAHAERYGHTDPEGDVVLVDVRLAMVAPRAAPRPVAAGGGATAITDRAAYFDGAWRTATVIRGEPEAGARFDGPAILELPESTFVIPPDWSAGVDDAGTIVAEHEAEEGIDGA